MNDQPETLCPPHVLIGEPLRCSRCGRTRSDIRKAQANVEHDELLAEALGRHPDLDPLGDIVHRKGPPGFTPTVALIPIVEELERKGFK